MVTGDFSLPHLWTREGGTMHGLDFVTYNGLPDRGGGGGWRIRGAVISTIVFRAHLLFTIRRRSACFVCSVEGQ
jgi:hypothetical protein